MWVSQFTLHVPPLRARPDDIEPLARHFLAEHFPELELASSATGVLYVARRKRQDSRVHQDIRAQLDLLGTPILGLVFNEG